MDKLDKDMKIEKDNLQKQLFRTKHWIRSLAGLLTKNSDAMLQKKIKVLKQYVIVLKEGNVHADADDTLCRPGFYVPI